MHFNKALLLWDRPEQHKYSGVVQRPTLEWHDVNTPSEVTLLLQPASVSLFLNPFDVQSNMEITDNKLEAEMNIDTWHDYFDI